MMVFRWLVLKCVRLFLPSGFLASVDHRHTETFAKARFPK